ncbi:MAG TPA: hypothetical protein VLW85_14015 [Myxococcales bacterium]|nr:hypothetical protein [Myxococcales bacterium]
MATIVNPGDTVELDPGEELQLKWVATPNIEKVEIFPVPIGNQGSKHVLYQPEASWGLLPVTPLSTCDIHGVAYMNGKAGKDDVFHVKVKGTNGLLHSFLAVSGSGQKRWAGDEMEVAQREPITFYWTAGDNAKSADINGTSVDPKAGKATLIATQSDDFTITVTDGGSGKEQQKVGVKVGSEVYDGYYDEDGQKLISNMVFTGGVALGGAEPSLLKAYWVEGPDGVAKISTEVEKGKSVTLKWKVSEEVNHIEIYNGHDNVKDVENEGDGEVEVEPQFDTDYIITVYAKQTWGEEGYKFMRATVHVGVHGEGEAVSEHGGSGWNYKFEAEKEWEIWKTPEQPLGKWFKWEIELGLKISGAVEVENNEEGKTLELGSKNGKEFALSLVQKWDETHGEEYKNPHLTPPQGTTTEFEPVKYDRSKGRLSVAAFTLSFDVNAHLKGQLEVKGIDVPVPYKTEDGEVNSLHFIEAEATAFAPLTSIDFPVAKGINVSQVTLGPYLKAKAYLDWVQVLGDAAKDAAEDAAEDALESAGELAGAEVALAASAVAIAVTIVAIYVMGIMEAAAIIELGKEAIEVPGDAKQGFLDGLDGSEGKGGYWYNRGVAVAEKLLMERRAHLKGLPKNKDLPAEEFEKRFQKSVEKHKEDLRNNSAINEVIAAARASLWKGYAQGKIDTLLSRNEKERQSGWTVIYGRDPTGSAEIQLFHSFDNHYTTQSDYGSGFRKA